MLPLPVKSTLACKSNIRKVLAVDQSIPRVFFSIGAEGRHSNRVILKIRTTEQCAAFSNLQGDIAFHEDGAGKELAA